QATKNNRKFAAVKPREGGWAGRDRPDGPSYGGLARRALGMCAERTAPVDDSDALLLRLDDEALEHAIAGERDQVARLEREHLLVAAEPRPRSETPFETECHLRDLAALGPAGRHTVEPLAVAAVHQHGIRDALT